MRILDLVKEHENLFLKDIIACKESGFKTYLYGAALGAESVIRRSAGTEIEFAGKLVDRKYFKNEPDVFCLEDVLEQSCEKINLVVAFRGFIPTSNIIQQYKDKINILVDRDCVIGNLEIDSHIFVTYQFIQDYAKELQWVYDRLVDETSRKTMIAYINQKISLDWKYLREVKADIQYFEQDIIHFSHNETFVDCGAYNGDSAIAFVTALKEQGINQYDEIISFEPDSLNYETLCSRGLKNHTCIKKGTLDRKEILRFSGAKSKGSCIAESGDVVIETDTIDSVLQGKKVTFIKMDVEGSELASLRGAKNTILKYMPTLAICIYHRREDLWKIPKYIHELVPSYKFYIRAYENHARELVLYAIL